MPKGEKKEEKKQKKVKKVNPKKPMVEKKEKKIKKENKEWKELPPCQVSDALLWEATKNYTSYLTKSNGHTLSTDPLNLTKNNTKRDSGIASIRAIGIDHDIVDRNIKVKKVKKKVPVVRFTLNIKSKKLIPKKKCTQIKEKEPENNHAVYTQREEVTIRAIVKALKRDLHNYRKDLVPIALRKLYLLYRFKENNKYRRGDKEGEKEKKA
jgi:hypothetical protein